MCLLFAVESLWDVNFLMESLKNHGMNALEVEKGWRMIVKCAV